MNSYFADDESLNCFSVFFFFVALVQVRTGDKVKQGQPLLVLSAMKMETNVASPADGIVKALYVKDGDNIQGNDLVAEIEV